MKPALGADFCRFEPLIGEVAGPVPATSPTEARSMPTRDGPDRPGHDAGRRPRCFNLTGIRSGAGFAIVVSALLAAGALLSLCCVSVVASTSTEGLVAHLLSIIIAIVALFVAVMSFAATGHREALVRSRFEQHLAPAVVRRILERPSMLKLSGERREITALFTDVEGFTAMTHHIDPEILVNALDNYFEGMANIIIAHGGMIDKIVGDGVHALFNAPYDLEDHPQKAVQCAIALCSWSEAFRHRPEIATIGFGRTRVGLETGPAIVGDVGIRAKLDYTAHGDAVNVAARLEAANKELGSSICIGPVAASRCDQSLLRPLGKILVRGRDGAMTVFEPSSFNTPTSRRRCVGAARRLLDEDPLTAAAWDSIRAEIVDPEIALISRLSFAGRRNASFPRSSYPCLRLRQPNRPLTKRDIRAA